MTTQPEKDAKDILKVGDMIEQYGNTGDDVVIVPLFPDSWCCVGNQAPAIQSMHRQNVPQKIYHLGVSGHEWQEWMEKISTNLVQNNTSQCVQITCWILMPCGFLYNIWAKTRAREKLQKMLDEFNEKVLEPKGMHARLRHALTVRGGGESSATYQGSWIAIGLTPEAIQKLKTEPAIIVDNGKECYCCDCCYSTCSACAFGGV